MCLAIPRAAGRVFHAKRRGFGESEQVLVAASSPGWFFLRVRPALLAPIYPMGAAWGKTR